MSTPTTHQPVCRDCGLTTEQIDWAWHAARYEGQFVVSREGGWLAIEDVGRKWQNLDPPAIRPRTRAGQALLDREAYNSRSFALITAEMIVAIEDEAARTLRSKVIAIRDAIPKDQTVALAAIGEVLSLIEEG